ncbi:MAG TPA: hypothetical protein ENN11_01670 [Methanomicrobia archaeon]|nr:hypothetical protein [Methanomicrobia archaeon]
MAGCPVPGLAAVSSFAQSMLNGGPIRYRAVIQHANVLHKIYKYIALNPWNMHKVGMGVDFDPVHKGHIHLIKEGKKVGDVFAYINEDYTAHHTPPFLTFEARREICEVLGVEAIPVRGLHYRLPLSYTVPIRIDMMARDGMTDIVDAAASKMSHDRIMEVSRWFAERGMLMGIPRSWEDRNLIRWVAANELHAITHKKRMGYHITPTYKIDNETVSGRYIRRAILETGRLTAPVRHLLPKESQEVIEHELKEGNIPLKRNMDTLLHVVNTFSVSKLLKIANINVAAAEEIAMGRPYEDEETLHYPLRRAGYQHVLTNLAISCLENKVSRKEVAQLIDNYTKKNVTPKDQRIDSMTDRAFFVARASQTVDAVTADAIYRSGIDQFWDGKFDEVAYLSGADEATIGKLYAMLPFEAPPSELVAGVSLKRYETKHISQRTVCDITSYGGELYAEFRIPNNVIKGKMRLPAKEVTFVRYLLDSQLVPVNATPLWKDCVLHVRITYGLTT